MLSSVRPLASRVLAVLAAALAACGGGREAPSAPVVGAPAVGRPVLAPAYRPTGHAEAGDVFVHLFEWPWNDVAAECEAVLGPAGWRAVQVSPPQEHAVVAGAPWWQRYQPASYSIARSRSGTGAEFAAMVGRCRAAGVDVYVDAVINHMTAGAGTGSGGTAYTKYAYPGTWRPADFHAACGVSDYRSAANVQDCELLGLADLDTGSDAVRRRIADYLVGLVRLGVAGFRIDAAKHVQPAELDAIVALVNGAAAADGRARPYWFAEVIDYGGEGVRVDDYLGLGYSSGGGADLTEFRARGFGDKFRNAGTQRVADLRTFSASSWALLPSDKAVVFLENHDTQRDAGNPGVGYRDGQSYRLANVWLLAQPYGYPSVLSGYAFDRATAAGRDAGPPSDAAGATRPVRCAAAIDSAAAGQWVCEHRDPAIARTVAFRRAVAGTPLSWRWDDGANAIAFSRGDRGFVAINRGGAAVSAAVATGLPPGAYCDVLAGGRRAAGGCAGTRAVVGAGGTLDLAVPASDALVLQAGVHP